MKLVHLVRLCQSTPENACRDKTFLRCGQFTRCEKRESTAEDALGYKVSVGAAESPAVVCQICKQPKSPDNGTIGEVVRPSLSDFIKKKDPKWDGKGFICFDDLGKFRRDYVKEVLEDEIGELSALDHEVVESLQAHEILSSDISKQFEKKLTFGERLSDRIAAFGGSWTFIIFFSAVLLLWIVLNSFVLMTRAFDPYPYILMNLVLSALAALQAPVIMMSQNRSEARDRARGENDYKINLKAELEIRHLHEKIDHLLRRQYNRLFEIQQIQIELLEELTRKSEKAPPPRIG
jgi:uncharacterized membrane protein